MQPYATMHILLFYIISLQSLVSVAGGTALSCHDIFEILLAFSVWEVT